MCCRRRPEKHSAPKQTPTSPPSTGFPCMSRRGTSCSAPGSPSGGMQKAEHPQLRGGLSRAAEATASFRAAQAALWAGYERAEPSDGPGRPVGARSSDRVDGRVHRLARPRSTRAPLCPAAAPGGCKREAQAHLRSRSLRRAAEATASLHAAPPLARRLVRERTDGRRGAGRGQRGGPSPRAAAPKRSGPRCPRGRAACSAAGCGASPRRPASRARARRAPRARASGAARASCAGGAARAGSPGQGQCKG